VTEIFLSTFTALFSVVNPFGAMPVFVTLTQGYEKQEIRQQAFKASLYMIGILIVFFFAGKFILDFFGIRIEDMRIAGGILIVQSGLALLNPDPEKGKPLSKEVRKEGIEKDDISFTPVAMPLLSGPGSIAVIIGMFSKAHGEYISYIAILLSIVAVAFFSFLILISSERFTLFLGKGGMAAVSRMMGFIVLSIGISFIVNGVLSLAKTIIR
jgi:multiple antibiotic resistance protein